MAVLDALALSYLALSDLVVRLTELGVMAFGGLLAGLFHRGDGAMTRSAYFALIALVMLAAEAVQLLWLTLGDAVAGGTVWMLLLADLGSALVSGYLIGILAMARSRDAYGHGKAAVLAFIPILNFILLFAGPLKPRTARRIEVPILDSVIGIILGLACLYGIVRIDRHLAEQTAAITATLPAASSAPAN